MNSEWKLFTHKMTGLLSVVHTIGKDGLVAGYVDFGKDPRPFTVERDAFVNNNLLVGEINISPDFKKYWSFQNEDNSPTI